MIVCRYLLTKESAMGNKRDLNCKECDGDGYIWDYLGGCGDPECCGGLGRCNALTVTMIGTS
jgi:hypothetical protein